MGLLCGTETRDEGNACVGVRFSEKRSLRWGSALRTNTSRKGRGRIKGSVEASADPMANMSYHLKKNIL